MRTLRLSALTSCLFIRPSLSSDEIIREIVAGRTSSSFASPVTEMGPCV